MTIKGAATEFNDHKIHVRGATLKDQRALANFYYKAFGKRARFKYPERWNWQFNNNPWRDNNALPVYIAHTPRGDILGNTAASRVPCKIFDTEVQLGWSVDTIVLPEARGHGLGKQLQRINQENQPVFASLSMTAINRHIKIKMGASLGPSTALYLKVMKPHKDQKSRQFFDVALYFFDYTAMSVISFFQRRFFSPKNDGRLWDIVGPKEAIFNDEDTQLWKRIRGRYAFAVERHADYLNWRYASQPWSKHYCCRAYNKEGLLSGLIVYRIADETTLPVIIITEFLVCDPLSKGIVECLFSVVECHASAKGTCQIQVAVSEPEIEAAIKKIGYINKGSKQLVINGPKELVSGLSNDIKALLSKGDQDWDQYPLATIISYPRKLAFSLFKDLLSRLENLTRKLYRFRESKQRNM